MAHIDNRGSAHNVTGRDQNITTQHNYICGHNIGSLRWLTEAQQAAFNTKEKEHDPVCLPNTRLQVLQQIRTWAEKGDERYIFWLSGRTGTGKSTIARTIAREYYDKQNSVASFFFSREGEDTSHAEKFVGTLALQLAERCAEFSSSIKAIPNIERIASLTQKDQWNELILQPLSMLGPDPLQAPFLIVIDALDECDSRGVALVLQLLSSLQRLSQPPRVFITSRPCTKVQHGFARIPNEAYQSLVLHDIAQSITDDDIYIFLKYTLDSIRQKRCPYKAWPVEDDIKYLVRKAAGRFIWAAAACRFIDDGEYCPSKKLCDLLPANSSSIKPNEEFNAIDFTVLKDSIGDSLDKEEKKEFYNLLKPVLGTIMLLFSPLAVTSLVELLNVREEKVMQILEELHSILDIPKDPAQPIRVRNLPFRDFLLDEARCRDPYFAVDKKQTHRDLAASCIALMEVSLKKDICSIRAPGTLLADISKSQVDKCLRAEVQYACLYWIQHVEESEDQLYDNGPLHEFLKKHFLHWLEALALLEKVSEGIHAIASLETLIQQQTQKNLTKENDINNEELHSFINDASQFTVFSQPIIKNSPLQIYCSALLFAPEKSIIKKRFRDQMPCWFDCPPVAYSDWAGVLHSVGGCLGSVDSVAFSPDGSRIVSGSSDNLIRIWETATGKLLQTLKGCLGSVDSVVFSPDGSRIVSESRDHSIRVWETATGKLIQTIKDLNDNMKSVALSPNGDKVILRYRGYDTQVLEVATGKLLQPLTGCLTKSVAFSPDGSRMVAGSDIWETTTGKLLKTLQIRSKSVNSVAFSPDGSMIMTGSQNCNVQLWETATGKLLKTLQIRSKSVNSVAFSPDGGRIVIGSYYCTIQVFEVATTKLLQNFGDCSSLINSVAFSPNGDKIVSGSYNGIIQLWEIATEKLLLNIEGCTSLINSVAFSPSGDRILLGFCDYTIHICDAATGKLQHILRGQKSLINSVAFSPDSSRIISGSSDGTILVWKAANGKILQKFRGHHSPVTSVVFSPDSMIMAGSQDCTGQVLEVATGELLQTLGGSSCLNSVAFSPDGSSIVVGSQDCTVQVWKAATGKLQQTLRRHESPVKTVAFSPDGGRIISGSQDCTVQVWEAATGKLLQTLKRLEYSSAIPCMALAVASDTLICSVDNSNQWITIGNLRSLYIPLDWRPGAVATHGSTLAIGTRSGRLMIFSFRSAMPAQRQEREPWETICTINST